MSGWRTSFRGRGLPLPRGRQRTPSAPEPPQGAGKSVGERALPGPVVRPPPHPFTDPQALGPPTCVRRGRGRSRVAPRSPAIPPPTGPEEPLQKAARATAALGPRSAVAAHGTVLFPPSRSPADHGQPTARSSIPRVRRGGAPHCGSSREPWGPAPHRTPAWGSRARPAP